MSNQNSEHSNLIIHFRNHHFILEVLLASLSAKRNQNVQIKSINIMPHSVLYQNKIVNYIQTGSFISGFAIFFLEVSLEYSSISTVEPPPFPEIIVKNVVRKRRKPYITPI